MLDLDIDALRKSARQASHFLKTLSNENRLLILCQLSHGEKSVGELQELIGLAQPALSQHLARLRQEGLAQTRRQSQTIYYSLKGDAARQVIAMVYQMHCTLPLEEAANEADADKCCAGSP